MLGGIVFDVVGWIYSLLFSETNFEFKNEILPFSLAFKPVYNASSLLISKL